jgi:hypothetical protein
VDILSRAPHVSICGLQKVLFYDPTAGQTWRYSWPGDEPWVYGATFCYRRSFWECERFPEISEGEDTLFVHAAPEHAVMPLDRETFYVGIIHPGNTSAKRTDSFGWVQSSDRLIREVLGEHWRVYSGPTKIPSQ